MGVGAESGGPGRPRGWHVAGAHTARPYSDGDQAAQLLHSQEKVSPSRASLVPFRGAPTPAKLTNVRDQLRVLSHVGVRARVHNRRNQSHLRIYFAFCALVVYSLALRDPTLSCSPVNYALPVYGSAAIVGRTCSSLTRPI